MAIINRFPGGSGGKYEELPAPFANFNATGGNGTVTFSHDDPDEFSSEVLLGCYFCAKLNGNIPEDENDWDVRITEQPLGTFTIERKS